VPVQRAVLHFTFKERTLLKTFPEVVRFVLLRDKPDAQTLCIHHSSGIIRQCIQKLGIGPADFGKAGTNRA